MERNSKEDRKWKSRCFVISVNRRQGAADVPGKPTSIQRQQDQLSSYVEERYEEAAQQDGESYVQGLLAAAGLQAKEIRVKTDRNAQGSIVMTEVAVRFVYPSEAERARALLSGVLGDEVRITVETGEEETSAA